MAKIWLFGGWRVVGWYFLFDGKIIIINDVLIHCKGELVELLCARRTHRHTDRRTRPSTRLKIDVQFGVNPHYLLKFIQLRADRSSLQTFIINFVFHHYYWPMVENELIIYWFFNFDWFLLFFNKQQAGLVKKKQKISK